MPTKHNISCFTPHLRREELRLMKKKFLAGSGLDYSHLTECSLLLCL